MTTLAGVDGPFVPLFIVVAGLGIALVIYGIIRERKRREAMALLARKLGFRYRPAKDRRIPARFRFLDRLAQGSNRYAFNVLCGSLDGEEVLVFDYHYETYSTDSKGNRQTHHHYFSFFILTLPRSFPEVTISHEGILSKIAQAVGFDDIDFESHEFSRSFCVRSRDKRFAYDVLNARMIDYLLGNRDLMIEIEGPALALGFRSRLAPEAIEGNLGRLRAVRERIPDYLFAEA